MPIRPHKHTGTDSPRLKTTDIQTTDGLPYTSDDDVVHKTGAETIAGIKTFSSIPVLPASSPTADNEMVRKKYVSDNAPAISSGVSTVLIDSADAERTIDSGWTNWHLLKQITFNERNGTITVKFDLKDDNGSGGCFGKVYINGVAAGTLREETASIWTTYSENFSVSTNDLIQVYGTYDNSGGGVGGLCRNMRMYYQKTLTPTVGTVITD